MCETVPVWCPKINCSTIIFNAIDKHPHRKRHSISVSSPQNSTTRKWFVNHSQNGAHTGANIALSKSKQRCYVVLSGYQQCQMLVIHYDLLHPERIVGYNDIASVFLASIRFKTFAISIANSLTFLFDSNTLTDFLAARKYTERHMPIGFCICEKQGVNIACKWINEPFVMQTH